jgi:hypothetical protein
MAAMKVGTPLISVAPLSSIWAAGGVLRTETSKLAVPSPPSLSVTDTVTWNVPAAGSPDSLVSPNGHDAVTVPVRGPSVLVTS